MNGIFLANLGWIVAAAFLGFVIAAFFAGILRLPRGVFLVAYLAAAGPFLYAFARWSSLPVGNLVRQNWAWGLAAAAVIAVFTIRNVRAQPASGRSRGAALVFDIAWLGVVYGGLDALFLSVLPVLAAWQAFDALGWTGSLGGKILAGLFALLASLFVTVAYHLGYPEYRTSGGVRGPSIGNGVISLGFILTRNPIASVLSHIAMHVAGVLRGPASVMQLPPHY